MVMHAQENVLIAVLGDRSTQVCQAAFTQPARVFAEKMSAYRDQTPLVESNAAIDLKGL
jgi:hypothetical protein